MRRTGTAALLALCTAVLLSTGSLSAPARATGTQATKTTSLPATAAARAYAALDAATRVWHGEARRTDGTTALLRLRLSMHALPAVQRRQAAAILARPTQHPDPAGYGYSVPARRKCSAHICIHWVTTTSDAPPSTAWVDRSLSVMEHVWRYEVHTLGYRRPISDGTRGGGGSGRFDVYLKELTGRGLYGLTVAEKRSAQNPDLYSSYLLLDNDFVGYPSGPLTSLKVTAAHEFFHAIQFGYDVRSDVWLKEATATWMEEQFDDAGNDNRQYLRYGQVNHPGTPLDTGSGFAVYGNWLFFQYLSQHYGRGVVKRIWNRAAAFRGGGHEFSAEAIRSALTHHGGLTRIFARYAIGNTVPSRTYAEGAAYPSARMALKRTLTRTARSTGPTTFHVKHLASANVQALPGPDLSAAQWRLRVAVQAPTPDASPAVAVLVQRIDHPMLHTLVHLDRRGHGTVRVPFSAATTTSVTVTLANASTRFRCNRGTRFSCQGTPRAAHPAYRLTLTAVR